MKSGAWEQPPPATQPSNPPPSLSTLHHSTANIYGELPTCRAGHPPRCLLYKSLRRPSLPRCPQSLFPKADLSGPMALKVTSKHGLAMAACLSCLSDTHSFLDIRMLMTASTAKGSSEDLRGNTCKTAPAPQGEGKLAGRRASVCMKSLASSSPTSEVKPPSPHPFPASPPPTRWEKLSH